jgi:hypothetical protein
MKYLSGIIEDIPVTHFYSSEPYGEKVADYLKIKNRTVDLEKKSIPVNATIIRDNYEDNKNYLENLVYLTLKNNKLNDII